MNTQATRIAQLSAAIDLQNCAGVLLMHFHNLRKLAQTQPPKQRAETLEEIKKVDAEIRFMLIQAGIRIEECTGMSRCDYYPEVKSLQ